jgi:hypothetical protein
MGIVKGYMMNAKRLTLQWKEEQCKEIWKAETHPKETHRDWNLNDLCAGVCVSDRKREREKTSFKACQG